MTQLINGLRTQHRKDRPGCWRRAHRLIGAPSVPVAIASICSSDPISASLPVRVTNSHTAPTLDIACARWTGGAGTHQG
jgi:hypothetical protein